MSYARQAKLSTAEHAMIAVKARLMWDAFDENQRMLVRFGMFPAEAMAEADAEGFPGHGISCALMDIASKNGGMRA